MSSLFSATLFERIIASVALPAKGEGALWYVDDEEFRHFMLFDIGITRGSTSCSLTLVVLCVQFLITWPRKTRARLDSRRKTA